MIKNFDQFLNEGKNSDYSELDWKMDKYMFAPGQMFSINNTRVPLLNRVIDTLMGAVLFIWSNNLTKVQNAASNYSLSFNRLKYRKANDGPAMLYIYNNKHLNHFYQKF